MATSMMVSLLLAALVPTSAVADTTPAGPIAYWTNPNAAVIRNLIWISGGDRYSNTTGFQEEYVPTDGALYNISLCDAFSTAGSNIDFLKEQPLYPKSNSPPYYIGGAMFATDNTFYTYGGMQNKNFSDTGVIFGQVAQVNAGASNWQPGFTTDWTVSDGGNVSVTARDFALGGWTSAPSDELAFWFGGMRTPDYSPVTYGYGDSGQANTPATDFIMFDLGQSSQGTSYNMTWPAGVKPRAEGALVWLPYNKGMLLAFGGIEIPTDQSIAIPPPIYDSSNNTNTYMTDILVYDVASNTWQHQQTDRTAPDAPGTLASFCTVVASAPDNSSHHIYVYGGYDGTYTNPDASDVVWVLSIPAFRWTKVSNGNPIHRRQNHVCVNMNANTMLSIGGELESGQPLLTPAFDVYDLNSLTWTSEYSPNATATYTVPATVTSNVPDMTSIPTNLQSQVSTWLGLKYQGHITGPILEGCPAVISSTPTPGPTPGPSPVKKKSIVGPAVGGAVGGAAVIAGLVLLFCCFRRRRRGNRSMDTNRNSIFSWMDRSTGHHSAPKSMPDSENTVIASPGVEYFGIKGHQVEAYEMPSNVPSPGYNHSYSHGSPQIVPGGSATSPFLGSVEVDAQSRHEIMDHQPRAGSSFGPNPYSMHSVSARQNPMSVRSDSVSQASEAVMHSRHYGYVSPYELAHDRSNENLATPPTDLALGEPQKEQRNASTHSLGVGAEKVNSPTVMTPIAPITRTIDSVGTVEETDAERPHHKRNQSSISSNLPNLPSPGPEEDRRRSRLLETLPDRSNTGTSSPVQPQTAKTSAYTENLDA